MAHISIPKDGYCELLNFTPVNPLISKCQIKVCYVQDDPNRNRSVITKSVATEMAKGLPGSPIVGFYNKETGDFEEHNRVIKISNGKFSVVDETKAYGFVDMNARVWFQKFLDDGIEHEYLMTEGYIWTKVYPESQRVITNGNNQSMELNQETLKGNWAKSDNGEPDFFIINEALIEKLCILGEDVEPCFEGAGISAHFSLDEDFKNQLFSMIREIKVALEEGGTNLMDNENKLNPEQEEQLDPTFAKKKEDEEKKDEEKKDNPFAGKGKDDKEDSSENEEDKKEDKGEDKPAAKEDSEEEDDKKKKKNKYNLEEIPEYVELNSKFAALTEEVESLKAEIAPLREYRAAAERKEKQEMINSFYMLSDEEKKDCIDNIDNYSLNDIEAKLSIICVRNKVSFNLDEDKEKESNPTTYSLQDEDQGDSAPAWIKAVRDTAKNL